MSVCSSGLIAHMAERRNLDAEDVSCVGAQSFYPPLNVCLDPPCSEYVFVELDDDTKTCRWVSWGPPLLASFVLAVAIADFVVHKLYSKAVSRARALAS